MTSKLELYILANNNAAPFPSEAEQIVLYDFSHTAQRMGEAPEITATIQADGVIENSLSTKVFCEYNGERYYLKSLPSSSKDNTDPRYSFELTFVSERTILDNVYMIDAVQGNSGLDRYQSNSTNVVFMGDINEAVARLNAAMTYTGVGYSVVIDSGISTESKQVSFADKYFTEVLQEYAKTYGIPYYFVGKVAHFGWAQYDVPTVKYLDGLISVSKDNQNNRIINRATATGSSDNIPYYYPNPTPRGVITYSVPNGVTVISEHKLALLPVGSSLVYIPETQEIAVKGTYGFLRITDRQPDFSVSDQTATLIIPQYDSSEGQIISGPVALLKNTFPESKNFTTTVVVRHPKGALTPSADNMLPIYPLNAIACTRVDDVLVEDASVIVSVASSNTVASQNYANDEETTFKLNISDFPAGEERYIYLRFLNPSSLRSDSKIIQFSFSVSERGLLQGWHIQDANNAVNEAVVNATDYGLRVSDSFTTGTVSYSVVSKIPFATTLMPPIYRESNGEQRFYNATNGEYSGITFENEYSAESRKEGITKFEDIKPTIKGITNAAGYRIDMFSAFAYDLNDNDATILSDGNTEEYQHPYFYAKLRKIDGAYGFNLFDQALESGEMTVSMTSGACGACKFTIMVDKNTQRNLVMVDDDGNLMYDASGNVMMATDARGLDKQNDTINNEVWIALKKDNSTFGQVMPNVEYGHYPSTSDTFVLLHILMPEVYIKNAEERLKSAIIDFLVANNSALFNTAINFSRIYLHDNPDKVAIITENSRIGVEYNGKEHTYFISSVTYRKAKSDILPEISVELTQDIQPTTSNIQAAISAITVTQQQVTEIVDKSEKQPKYLKSDTADTAQGKITFEKGLDFAGNLNSKGFKRGALDGKGFGVYSDSEGRMIVEADKVISRQGGCGGGSGLRNYVTTDTEQVVTAHKDFAAGISMYGIPWEYDVERDAWTIKGNVIITKGLATYSALKEDDVLSVFDGLPIDNVTLQWQEAENGKILVAVGGGSGGGLDESKLQDYLDEKKYVTESWVTGKNYALKSELDTVSTKLNNFLEGSDTNSIIDKWSELEVFLSGLTETDNLATILSGKANKSTTLAGYGITNAYTKTEVQDNFLAIDGIADRAKILAGSLTSTDYIVAAGNGFNVMNTGTTGRFWFGYGIPSGSKGTYRWIFGSGGGVATQALGEIHAKSIILGDTSGNFNSPSYTLHAKGSTRVDGTFYLNGAPLTYNSSKNAWQLEGNLIVTGGLATYTKLSGFTDLDVMGGVVTDGTTIHINSAGQLEVIGGTSGGGGITLDDVADYLSDNDYITSSGNANSATNIVLGTVSPSSTTSYYPAMVTGTTNGSKYGIKVFGNPVRYALKAGTTSATGIAELILGNSTNSGSSGNSEGALCLYPATSSYYSILKASSNVSGNYTNYLPKSSGTLLNENSLKTINGNTLVGSGNITISGGSGDVDLLNTENIEPASNMTYNVGSASYVYNTGYFQNIQPYRAYALRVYTAASSSSSFVERLRVGASGKITVALTSDSQAKEIFNVVGNIYTTGTVTESSARKMKDVDYEGEGIGLDVLKKVKVAKWHWKDKRDKRMHIGAIAEDLAEIIPEAVFDTEADDGSTTPSIAYGKAGFSIAASLIAPVARHEDRIKELEKNIEKMQKELNQLRKTA